MSLSAAYRVIDATDPFGRGLVLASDFRIAFEPLPGESVDKSRACCEFRDGWRTWAQCVPCKSGYAFGCCLNAAHGTFNSWEVVRARSGWCRSVPRRKGLIKQQLSTFTEVGVQLLPGKATPPTMPPPMLTPVQAIGIMVVVCGAAAIGTLVSPAPLPAPKPASPRPSTPRGSDPKNREDKGKRCEYDCNGQFFKPVCCQRQL